MEYRDFTDVFSEVEAEALPPHRTYDCQIDLVPGAVVPAGYIYPLFETENQPLRTYIDERLRKGFIHLSRSHAGATIFFFFFCKEGHNPPSICGLSTLEQHHHT